jgi:histone H3/H4
MITRPQQRSSTASEDRSIQIQPVACAMRRPGARGIQDVRIVNLLFENIEEIRKSVAEKQEQTRHYYRTEVETS